MSPEKDSKDTLPDASLWGAITEVVKGLSKQPILLYGFGLAIILLAAGSLALENLRVIAIALIGLCIIALAAWILSAALKRKAAAENFMRIRGGHAQVASDIEAEGSRVVGGKVKMPQPLGSNVQVSGGDAKVGKRSRLKDSTVKGGDVEIK